MLQKHEGRKKHMFKKTFKGGVHPDDGKRYAKDASYRTYLPQGELVFPMSQHIGKPAKPVVKKGDMVLAGQLRTASYRRTSSAPVPER